LTTGRTRDRGAKSFEVVARSAEFDLMGRQSSCFPNMKEIVLSVLQHIVYSCCNGLSGVWITVIGSTSSGTYFRRFARPLL
jgi:hypothetical protein